MSTEMDYIDVAKRNGCTLIYNPKYYGHVLYYKGVSEIVFKLDRKTLDQFNKFCVDFVKRNTKI